jgi:hypothetical protein
MKLEEGVWQEERDKCEGEERTTESNGDRWVWSKCVIYIYANVIMKLIILDIFLKILILKG